MVSNTLTNISTRLKERAARMCGNAALPINHEQDRCPVLVTRGRIELPTASVVCSCQIPRCSTAELPDQYLSRHALHSVAVSVMVTLKSVYLLMSDILLIVLMCFELLA